MGLGWQGAGAAGACVCVCVLGGGWGPPPPTTDLCHHRGVLATHTRKSRRKSQHSGQYDFCEKPFPYEESFFGAPKGALGADTLREFGAPRIAPGRHFLGHRVFASSEKRRFFARKKCGKTSRPLCCDDGGPSERQFSLPARPAGMPSQPPDRLGRQRTASVASRPAHEVLS